jgi:hypothetical protein
MAVYYKYNLSCGVRPAWFGARPIHERVHGLAADSELYEEAVRSPSPIFTLLRPPL